MHFISIRQGQVVVCVCLNKGIAQLPDLYVVIQVRHAHVIVEATAPIRLLWQVSRPRYYGIQQTAGWAS